MTHDKKIFKEVLDKQLYRKKGRHKPKGFKLLKQKLKILFFEHRNIAFVFITVIIIVLLMALFILFGTWNISNWVAGLDQKDELKLPGKKLE